MTEDKAASSWSTEMLSRDEAAVAAMAAVMLAASSRWETVEEWTRSLGEGKRAVPV